MLDTYLRGCRGLVLVAAFGVLGCHKDCPGSLAACPAIVPVNGAPCTGTSPVGGCEYGNDPWYACDTVAVCAGSSGWNVQTERDPSCPTSLPTGCPATFAEARAAATCSAGPTSNPTCRYLEGICQCQAGKAAFTCTPPAAAGCPSTRPRSGTPCDGSCGTWGSGSCDNESMICACGVWQLIECTD